MNPKIEDVVKSLRGCEYCYDATCGACPTSAPGTPGCSAELMLIAADLIEQLRQELIDERYRHDRVQDFCVAQGEELSKIKRAAEADSGDGLPERADMEGIENLLAEANADALGIMWEE